jgi:hypothetical protein
VRSVVVGLSLGVMMGLPTSPILVVLIRQLGALHHCTVGLHYLIGEVLALPTFWVGGPWATGRIVQVIDLPQVVPWYFPSLVCTLMVFVLPSLLTLSYETRTASRSQSAKSNRRPTVGTPFERFGDRRPMKPKQTRTPVATDAASGHFSATSVPGTHSVSLSWSVGPPTSPPYSGAVSAVTLDADGVPVPGTARVITVDDAEGRLTDSVPVPPNCIGCRAERYSLTIRDGAGRAVTFPAVISVL